MESIKFKNVHKSFGKTKILEDINFELENNQITCLVGPSGCGKTTFLNLLSKRFEPDEGGILNIEDKKISYVFQKSRLLPWLTLEDNIKFVLENKIEKKEITKQIQYWLTQLELDGAEKKYPSQLSGGMEQRASLARAFAVPSDLLLMDEPFKGLDEPLKFRMLQLMYKLWQKNSKTIIFVTHDIREALLIGDKIVIFKEKPAQILEEIKVDIPHEKRHIGCHQMAKLEEYIYNTMNQKSNSKCIKKVCRCI